MRKKRNRATNDDWRGEGVRTLNIIEKHQIEMKIKVHACQMGNRMQPN